MPFHGVGQVGLGCRVSGGSGNTRPEMLYSLVLVHGEISLFWSDEVGTLLISIDRESKKGEDSKMSVEYPQRRRCLYNCGFHRGSDRFDLMAMCRPRMQPVMFLAR